MNIFFLDYDPIKAAQMLCDKHVGRGQDACGKKEAGKMIVESAQMLANCYPLERLAESDCPRTQKKTARKHSYFNHPCSKWVRKSIHNYYWLLEHAMAQVDEKQYRGGSNHFCSDFINWCFDNKPNLPEIDPTKPAQAMPEDYQNINPVTAYRDYYYYDKYKGYITDSIDMKWTIREQPEWWKNYET